MSFLSTLPAEALPLRQDLRQQILTVDTGSFESVALAVFRYQAQYNPVYRNYLHCLNVQPATMTQLSQVPFMPIGFFKHHTILTGFDPGSLSDGDLLTFASSGTTGRSAGFSETSQHLVPDPALYDAVSTRIFEQRYGSLRNFHILALLPSYLERNNSSLVYMVQRFMALSHDAQSSDSTGGGVPADTSANFFLNNLTELTARLRQLTDQPDGKRILLIGVTFALLDWAESGEDLRFLARNPNLVVMETGGMKGRRKELLREEVHQLLIDRLGIAQVHSEYGMTELLSQAYSAGEGVFLPSPTLRVLLRDINDPFQLHLPAVLDRRSGGINVVDLANLDSCSFIETQDLGQYVGSEAAPGAFRVIGRFDNSDVRGCNLMVV
ncbi:LuxE/PaaK family acyltransferase [Spirosoma rigui]|uniref:LuxE/PaaK family acyltransferase n=1 Tax=Spirosoma rigui TaxID=564064 RepID=UPI0009AF54CC|nr:acyl transferase [Spirosoma rigui]